MKEKEYWVVCPFSGKGVALEVLRKSHYRGIVIEKEDGEYATAKKTKVTI